MDRESATERVRLISRSAARHRTRRTNDLATALRAGPRQPQWKIRRPHLRCSFNRKGCAGGTPRRDNPSHIQGGKPPARVGGGG